MNIDSTYRSKALMKRLGLVVAALLMQSAVSFGQNYNSDGSPSAIYANGGSPDLFPHGQRLIDSLDIVTRNFSKNSCEMVEGSIAAAGTRRLLRFDQEIVNGG